MAATVKYLLDTNACIEFINGKNKRIRERINAHDNDDIYLCSVVRGELIYGARLSAQPEKALVINMAFIDLFKSLPYDDSAADAYSSIRADLRRKGQMIGANDLIIAAIAMSRNLVLVTHNLREFSRIETLMIEDWQV